MFLFRLLFSDAGFEIVSLRLFAILSTGIQARQSETFSMFLPIADVGKYLLPGYFLLPDISLILWTFLKNHSLSESKSLEIFQYITDFSQK